MKKIFIIICLIVMTIFNSACNPTRNMVAANENIDNLKNVLNDAQSKISWPIFFPELIPNPKKKLYAGFNVFDQRIFQIHVGTIPFCENSSYCTIGSMLMTMDGTYDYYRSSKVKLANGIIGRYRYGSIEWMMKWDNQNVLYTLLWRYTHKRALIAMANSVITQSLAKANPQTNPSNNPSSNVPVSTTTPSNPENNPATGPTTPVNPSNTGATAPTSPTNPSNTGSTTPTPPTNTNPAATPTTPLNPEHNPTTTPNAPANPSDNPGGNITH